MNPNLKSFGVLTRQPSALLPTAMSLFAFVTVLIGPTIFGDLRAPDEGPTAHIWQLLIVGQIPLLAFFAYKWLRRSPKQASQVLALQAGALSANFAMVFYLGTG